jgi:hypothetical protein
MSGWGRVEGLTDKVNRPYYQVTPGANEKVCVRRLLPSPTPMPSGQAAWD